MGRARRTEAGSGQLRLPVTGAGYGEEPNQALLLTVKEAAKLMRIGRDTAYAAHLVLGSGKP